MIANYYTKPLQGRSFKIFSGVIMVYSHVDTLLTLDLPIEDRFEKGNKSKLTEKNQSRDPKIDFTLTQ